MNGFVGSRKAKLAKIKYPNAPASIATGNVQFFRKFNIAPSFIFGRKGTKFFIEGRIQTGSYTNKDGQKVYTTDVVVENTEFGESKNNQQNNDNPPPAPRDNDSFMSIPDDIGEELPFN